MLKQVLDVYELLSDAHIDGPRVLEFLKSRGLTEFETRTIRRKEGTTDFIKIVIPGREGKKSGRQASTLGIIGRLGGIGARPECIGLVSDADGAVTALSCALKLADMQSKGDVLKGDVVITTHICPNAPTLPHKPVAFMGSPVDTIDLLKYEVDSEMDAILSVDTTRGNRIINHKGIAISATVKEGYILRISEDLLDLLAWTTGRPSQVLPITMQDITPYGNELFHINSIMQPCTVTDIAVVGVALTTDTVVPGCGTGASHEVDIRDAVAFCLEVAKAFTEKKCRFYDKDEFNRIVGRYGRMNILQTLGKE
jgi:hypothetical protein